MPERKSFRERLTPDYIALWVIAIVSLLLNVVILRELVMARNAAREAIVDAIASIDDFQKSTISTNIAVDEVVVIDTDLPVNESVAIQIKDTLPIDTILDVPVNGGLLGILNLKVPIKTNIPVDIKPTVTINQTFHVKAPVPLKLNVPVEIDIASTGLGAALEALKLRLQVLAVSMGAPVETPTPSAP